jgi:hypothetical protein
VQGLGCKQPLIAFGTVVGEIQRTEYVPRCLGSVVGGNARNAITGGALDHGRIIRDPGSDSGWETLVTAELGKIS